MSRAFNLAKLRARKTYKGGHYINGTFREFETAGAEWRTRMHGLRVEHNGDCVAAYNGATLIYEVYE